MSSLSSQLLLFCLIYPLVSGICYSGSLHSDHYTALARDVCGGSLHLNDKAVIRTTLEALNGRPLPYVLFYQACEVFKN